MSNSGVSNDDNNHKLSSLLSDNQRVCKNSFLTEEDIPGTSIKEPYEKYSMNELRWWLPFRGVTVATMLRKAEIIVKINFHAFLRNMCEKPLNLYCKSAHIFS